MHEFVIRELREDDLESVGEMTVDSYTPYETDNLSYLDVLRDVRPRFEQAFANLVVENTAGDVVGAVSLSAAGTEFAHVAVDGELEMRMLAVAPSVQHRGVGTLLVREAQRIAQEEGFTQLVLSSRKNMHNAHRLYEKLGFEIAPSRFWEPIPGKEVFVYTWSCTH